MPVHVTCSCGRTLAAPDQAAGQRVRCPECGAVIDVPAAAETPAPMPVGHQPISTPRTAPTKPFLEEVALAFKYPMTIKGILVLIFGALAFMFLMFLGFGLITFLFSIIGYGYLAAFFLNIVQTSAGGDKEMPGLPDLNEFMDEAVKPFLFMAGVIAVCMVPQMIYGVICYAYGLSADGGVLEYLGFISAAYFPMAIMSVAIWRSIAAVSPHIIIPTIFKIPGQYALMAVLVVVIWQGAGYALGNVTAWAAERELGLFLTLYLVFFVLLYFICVIGRIIGITHWIYRKKIGWFTRD